MTNRERQRLYRERNREKVRERHRLWWRAKHGYGRPRPTTSIATRTKISAALKGRAKSPEHLKAISKSLTGKPPGWEITPDRIARMLQNLMAWHAKHPNLKHSEETRRKIGEAHRGSRNHRWAGGVSSVLEQIRHSFEYREWRRHVFERDGYRCTWCLTKQGPFNADHIKEFAKHPELRFDINNGRTLCVRCHRKRHKPCRVLVPYSKVLSLMAI